MLLNHTLIRNIAHNNNVVHGNLFNHNMILLILKYLFLSIPVIVINIFSIWESYFVSKYLAEKLLDIRSKIYHIEKNVIYNQDDKNKNDIYNFFFLLFFTVVIQLLPGVIRGFVGKIQCYFYHKEIHSIIYFFNSKSINNYNVMDILQLNDLICNILVQLFSLFGIIMSLKFAIDNLRKNEVSLKMIFAIILIMLFYFYISFFVSSTIFNKINIFNYRDFFYNICQKSYLFHQKNSLDNAVDLLNSKYINSNLFNEFIMFFNSIINYVLVSMVLYALYFCSNRYLIGKKSALEILLLLEGLVPVIFNFWMSILCIYNLFSQYFNFNQNVKNLLFQEIPNDNYIDELDNIHIVIDRYYLDLDKFLEENKDLLQDYWTQIDIFKNNKNYTEIEKIIIDINNQDLLNQYYSTLLLKDINMEFSHKSIKYIYKDKCFKINFDENLMCCIKGNSGAGKTTFINCLFGLQQNLYTNVKINNVNINDIALSSFGKVFSYLFQNANSFGNITLEESFSLLGINYEEMIDGLNKMNIKDRFQDKLQELDYNVSKSGGEACRLDIIRSGILTNENSFVYIDESISALDVDTQNQMMELFKNNQKHLNQAFIVIEHLGKFNEISNVLFKFQSKSIDVYVLNKEEQINVKELDDGKYEFDHGFIEVSHVVDNEDISFYDHNDI